MVVSHNILFLYWQGFVALGLNLLSYALGRQIQLLRDVTGLENCEGVAEFFPLNIVGGFDEKPHLWHLNLEGGFFWRRGIQPLSFSQSKDAATYMLHGLNDAHTCLSMVIKWCFLRNSSACNEGTELRFSVAQVFTSPCCWSTSLCMI